MPASARIIQDLIERLKKHLNDPGFTFYFPDGGLAIRIPLGDDAVRAFVRNPDHYFRAVPPGPHPRDNWEEYFKVPFGWTFVQVKEFGGAGRALALLNSEDQVKMILLTDRSGEVTVELI